MIGGREALRVPSGLLGMRSPLWTGAMGGAVDPSPAVAGGVVFAGSYDGKLYAFAPA